MEKQTPYSCYQFVLGVEFSSSVEYQMSETIIRASGVGEGEAHAVAEERADPAPSLCHFVFLRTQ